MKRVLFGSELTAALLVLGCASAPSPTSRTPPSEAPTNAHGESTPGAMAPSVTPEPSAAPPGSAGATPPDGAERPHDRTEAPLAVGSADAANAAEDERRAYEQARPVFEQYCRGCHTTAAGKPGALRHLNIDSYPFGGHHASVVAAAVRKVLGAAGRPPTMPKDSPGAVKGAKLQAILDWADAFDRAHQSGAHVHDHADEHDHDHADGHDHDHADGHDHDHGHHE